MEDETIVDIDTKYVPTTLTYALPHASKNIKKNKIEGVTEHWLYNVYIFILLKDLI